MDLAVEAYSRLRSVDSLDQVLAVAIAIPRPNGLLGVVGSHGFGSTELTHVLRELEASDCGDLTGLLITSPAGTRSFSLAICPLNLDDAPRTLLIIRCDALDVATPAAPVAKMIREVARLLEMCWHHIGLQEDTALDTLLATVRQTSPASLFVDADMTVVKSVPAAVDLVDRFKSIELLPSRQIRLASGEADLALREAVNRVITAGTAATVDYLRLEHPRDETSLLAILRPCSIPTRLIRDNALSLGGGTRTLCWVELRDFADQGLPSSETLHKVFDFTPREAVVARELLRGVKPAAQAVEQGVGIDAINFHLKNIRLKTKCGSQSEIVQLIRSLIG